MYQIGEKVVYGVHGVCQIVDQETRVVDRKCVTYLVLEPLGQGSARYLVPTHNTAAMAKLKLIMTREELENLLRSEAIRKEIWIKDENLRKQTYRELIACGDRERLMQMVHTLYVHKRAQTDAGRKCHLCDENFLRDAEKLLIGEVSVILDVDPEQAKQYLRSNLKEA